MADDEISVAIEASVENVEFTATGVAMTFDDLWIG